MTDERQFGVQELTSARYLVEHVEDCAEPEVESPAPRLAPPRSGIENAVRWLTPVVILMIVGAVGGIYWQNHAAIASSAGELKNRRSVVDLLLWAGGSKKTFNQALSDKLKQAQRDSLYQFDQMKPAYETDFKNVDFSNLSDTWNSPANGKR